MSKGQRMGLIGAAVAVAIVAFVVLRAGEEEEQPAPAASGQTVEEASGESREESDAPKPEPPEPEVTKIEVEGGQPVDGVAEIEARKGEDVLLKVTADAPEEVHIHGYDVSKPVGPGQPASFDFTAELEGVYEIELENSAVPIAELRTRP